MVKQKSARSISFQRLYDTRFLGTHLNYRVYHKIENLKSVNQKNGYKQLKNVKWQQFSKKHFIMDIGKFCISDYKTSQYKNITTQHLLKDIEGF